MSKNAVDCYIDDILKHQHSQGDNRLVQPKIYKTSNLKKVEKTIIDKTQIVQIKVEYYQSASTDSQCLGESGEAFTDE